MSNNKLSLETVLPASSVTELKEDELKCPVDILCLADDCQAQDEDWDIKRRDAYCKTVSLHPIKSKRPREPC
jgi:hypothetical protein